MRINRSFLISISTKIALTAGFCAELLRIYALALTIDGGGNTLYDSEDFRFPPGWLFATIISVLFGGISGLIALTSKRTFVHSKTALIYWLLVFVPVFAHCLIAYVDRFSPNDLLSVKGPLVWLGVLILFAGFDRDRWRSISRLIYVFAYFASALVVISLIFLPVDNRTSALRAVAGYAPLLLATAPYIIFCVIKSNWILVLVGYIPLIAYGLTGVVTATRSTVIVFLLIIFVSLFLARKYYRNNARAFRIVTVAILIAVISTVSYLLSTDSDYLFALLLDRLSEDSRTGQYVDFFSQLTISDVLFGTGPFGTYLFNGVPYAYIDGSYTLLLFYGGVSVLVGYVLLIIRPAFIAIFYKPTNYSLPSAFSLLFWCIALTGLSTYAVPDISVSHLLYCLYAGKCIYENSTHTAFNN